MREGLNLRGETRIGHDKSQKGSDRKILNGSVLPSLPGAMTLALVVWEDLATIYLRILEQLLQLVKVIVQSHGCIHWNTGMGRAPRAV